MQEMAEEEERQRKRDEKDGTVNSVVLLKGEGEGNTGNEVDNPTGYSWVSLGYIAVNLNGGQPKMY